MDKSWDDFDACPSRRPFGLASKCKPCELKRKAKHQKKARQEQPDKYRGKDRRVNYQRKYGITIDEYEIMAESQNNCCAICKEPEKFIHHSTGKEARLAVDHDHETGVVRSLLCSNCNRGLGFFNENPDRLLEAAQYLLGFVPPENSFRPPE